MMLVIPRPAAIEALFRRTGPVGLLVEHKAEEVRSLALAIASGGGRPFVRSSDLVQVLQVRSKVTNEEGGAQATIGETMKESLANHRDFYYPAALEIGMPKFAPLGPNQTQSYQYPFLRPALLQAGFHERSR